MDIFKCKYLTHENEEIIGFCFNQNCQNVIKYCYECLTTKHSDHLNDCIRFPRLNQQINEFITVYNQFYQQFKEISTQVQNCFEQMFRIMEQDIKNLQNMTSQLQNKDYITFKSQINIIKPFQSKKKEVLIQKQIIQLENIIDTIKNMVTDLNKEEDQTIISDYINIEIQENYSEEKKQQDIKDQERLLNEGIALLYQKKYQEAIVCCEQVISINPKNDAAWNNKGIALNKLQKYPDAIFCYDQALTINITPLRLQRKADSLFELGKKSEAKKFYLNALEKGSNEKDYIQKQLSKL